MAIGNFTLTGHFDTLSGFPATGTVRIDGNPQIITDSAGNKVRVGPRTVVLNGTGDFSVTLPSDSTTGNSTSIAFKVTPKLTGLAIIPPTNFYARPIGSTVDLKTLSSVPIVELGNAPTGPKGDAGPKGDTGPQGLPGVNAFTEDPALSSTTYADVTLDANGRVSRATKTNGYNYFPLAEAVKAIIAGVTSTADQFGPYVSGTIDAAGKYAENVIGPNGRVPGWVLAAWLSRFDADTFAAKQGLFLPRTGYGAARTREGTLRRELSKLSVIECRGDSLTFGFGDNTQTGGWPTRLQTAIPAATVNNRGVSGMTSTELAIYDGAVIPIITVAGNSIPVGGTANVTLVAPTSSFQFNNGGGGTTVWTGTLGVGGPAATLNHNVAATSQTAGWTVTLTTPGAVTPVAPETPFIVASGAALGYDRDSLYLLADGRNNPVRADFLRDAVARINQLTPLRPRFLVFSILTASNETAGSAPYVDIVSTNQAAAALFGTNYLDVRRYIIDNAAAKIVAMGGTVSATDRQCIDNDTIPPSLHNPDNLHLNGWGYDLYETCVFAALTTKGWVAS